MSDKTQDSNVTTPISDEVAERIRRRRLELAGTGSLVGLNSQALAARANDRCKGSAAAADTNVPPMVIREDRHRLPASA